MLDLTYLLLVLIAPMALFGTGAQAENETDTEEYGSVIGIDLGTTYSYVCPCIVLTIPMERS